MRKIVLMIMTVLLVGSGLRAQSKDSVELKKIDTTAFRPIFTSAEISPSFPGGKEGWVKFIQENLNTSLGGLYIPIPKGETRAKQTAIISFIVNEDSTLSDFSVINVVHPKLAEEAIRVLKNSPKWNPAMQNGHIVAYRCKQAISWVVDVKN